MKTRLSMPRTISSTVNVTSAAHGFGSVRSDKAYIERLSVSPTLRKYKAITTSPTETHAAGARSFNTAISATADHTISPAIFSARSRATRTGWRNLNGTKVSTARQATIVAAIGGTGLSRNRENATRVHSAGKPRKC